MKHLMNSIDSIAQQQYAVYLSLHKYLVDNELYVRIWNYTGSERDILKIDELRNIPLEDIRELCVTFDSPVRDYCRILYRNSGYCARIQKNH